jgi:beta-glucosidase
MKKASRILLLLLFATTVVYIYKINAYRKHAPMIRWNWSAIDTEEMQFPDNFIWGTASAAHQVEGNNENSNFAWWEKQVDEDGQPRIENGDNSRTACEHYTRYAEDIDLMQELGTDAYRFSVSWSKLMPDENSLDTSVLVHYQQVCDSLLAAGIKPVVTLHHFTHPIWFMEKGGFTREENIHHFISFARTVFDALSGRVAYWCTFNEPGVYVIAAYFNGNFPPGLNDPEKAAEAYKNMIAAHVRLYDQLKETPEGQAAKIGIVKNFQHFDPMRRFNFMDWTICRLVDASFNESFLEAFRSGQFRFSFPTLVKVNEQIEGAAGKLDFIGLNYYSHNAMKFSFNLDDALELKLYPGEVPTDMEYTIYPEGIYRAIKRASTLEVPIIITENGLADSIDDRRALFIERYIYAVYRAMEEGADVRGYFYWSLMDNFEWDLGYGMRFGLYHVDFETQERSLREGSKKFIEIVNK